jgi:hypothetical protein
MNPHLHRLLDEAFAGVEMTPDAQDLKEEIRANLIARVAELEASGLAPETAARTAVAELGDVRELLEQTDAATPASSGGDPWTAAMRRHRVRPKPAFVVRIVIAAILAALSLLLIALAVLHLLPVPFGPLLVLTGVAATGVAWIVGDSLSQETTTNHPMPRPRAGGFFFATLVMTYGVIAVTIAAGFVLQGLSVNRGYTTRRLLVTFLYTPEVILLLSLAGAGIVEAIVLYAWLGATHTNRKKAWTRELIRATPPNRLEREPETAARFGIYTAVIWLVTFAVIAVLVFTVGWWWAPLAFAGGFAVMMLVLARMLFAPHR